MKAKVKATKVRKSTANRDRVEASGGNVFADLGFQDSEERLLKAKLATKIAQLIERKGWTQAQTAERTALDQPKVSRLLRGQQCIAIFLGSTWAVGHSSKKQYLSGGGSTYEYRKQSGKWIGKYLSGWVL